MLDLHESKCKNLGIKSLRDNKRQEEIEAPPWKG
uniref:Uncharacterized protein n=1 Tax=Podoviridae sp. ctz6O13 TaxID=2827757 RepID=A0A8S5TKQ5_9CAUD|nr:MAG TPA: hypothetical protein [Podoviridae sp. ctz6O13]